MSLFLAEIAGRMERERLEKIVNGLIPGRVYDLHRYYRYGLEQKPPKPEPIARGKFIQRQGNRLIFDDGLVVNYRPSYNSIVDAVSGLPVLSFNGIDISNIVEAGNILGDDNEQI